MKRKMVLAVMIALMISGGAVFAQDGWISLFNGHDLDGWFSQGKASWTVTDGAIIGDEDRGHLYSDVILSDFEVKGLFRISGHNSNSGFYFRAQPPENRPEGFPNGYEAQICHSQEAHTGWLWKPGTPTGKASKLLTQDGEWFSLRIKAIGPHILFWVNDELVMTHHDEEYTSGRFAIQMHHAGMKVEAKELYYRDLSK